MEIRHICRTFPVDVKVSNVTSNRWTFYCYHSLRWTLYQYATHERSSSLWT